MLNQFKQFLPGLAVLGAVVVVLCLILLPDQRRANLIDTGQTRPAVEQALAQLRTLRPTSPDEPGFRRAVAQTLQAPYIATVWLFAPDGQLLYGEGSTAAAGAAREQAAIQMNRILASLPAGTLTEAQQVRLVAAAAIQGEGEHNDIYRHLLRPVTGPDGNVIALVGVAYEVSPWVAAPDLSWLLGLLALLLGLGLYWLSLPLWVLLDARQRGERAWAWASYVFLGNLVALLAYLLARSPRPASAQG